MESTVETIARLREEKRLLLAAILKVEDWAFGEGYFITPTMAACFHVVRKLADDPADSTEHGPIGDWMKLRQEMQGAPAKRTYNISPERREQQRQKMREYWRKRKEERSAM